MKKTKIVLLARECDSSAIIYNFLKKSFEFESIIVEERISKINQFKKRIRLIGFWKATGQVLFMLLVFPILKWSSKKRSKDIFTQYQFDLTALPAGLIKNVKSLNAQKTRDLLKELDPDLIIVNGTRIISKKTLESVKAPFINIHTGITPVFRGVHGGYWAVAKGEKKYFGTTIHYVDPGVDTGGIIDQVFLEPDGKDNFYTYPYLQYAIVLPALKNVVQSFVEGRRPVPKQALTSQSGLWFHPTIFQWLANLKRTAILILPIHFIL